MPGSCSVPLFSHGPEPQTCLDTLISCWGGPKAEVGRVPLGCHQAWQHEAGLGWVCTSSKYCLLQPLPFFFAAVSQAHVAPCCSTATFPTTPESAGVTCNLVTSCWATSGLLPWLQLRHDRSTCVCSHPASTAPDPDYVGCPGFLLMHLETTRHQSL